MSTEPPRIFTLPLFPLGNVLFPQFPLQLHIFEERYKVMINQCIENDAPFGVILIREGQEVGSLASPHDVGCVARILGVERLHDDRLNILAVCERRFRVLDYMEADYPYLIGRVEELDDKPESSDVSQLTSEVTAIFIRYLRLLASHAQLPMPELELPEDPKTLAFCVASVAMLPPLRQQQLLEMTDTRARLEDELSLLREQVQELESSLGSGDPALLSSSRDSADTEDSADTAEDDGPHIVIAHPIDLKSQRWQRYIHSLRH